MDQPYHPTEYVKRPVKVNVYGPLRGDGKATIGLARLIGAEAVCYPGGWVIEIPTLEGRMRASVGDYIIEEPSPTKDRRYYPCKPKIFEATYEAVES